MTRYLLNSAVIAAGAHGVYRYATATVEDLRAFVAPERPVSRVGYPETAARVERWTGWRPPLSREASALEPGDVAMVVRLGYRVEPGRKGRPVAAPEDAWEVARLERLADPDPPREAESVLLQALAHEDELASALLAGIDRLAGAARKVLAVAEVALPAFEGPDAEALRAALGGLAEAVAEVTVEEDAPAPGEVEAARDGRGAAGGTGR